MEHIFVKNNCFPKNSKSGIAFIKIHCSVLYFEWIFPYAWLVTSCFDCLKSIGSLSLQVLQMLVHFIQYQKKKTKPLTDVISL